MPTYDYDVKVVDGVVDATPFGAELLEGFVAGVDASAGAAAASAAQASAAVASVPPRGTATVASNDATTTVYNVVVPAGIGLENQGRQFEFQVPATALGATVRLNVSYSDGTSPTNPTRDVFFATRRTFREGWLATVSANNGGIRWNFVSQLPDDLSFFDTEIETDVGFAAVTGITGATQSAKPIRGNPNELFIPNAPRTDSLRVTWLMTQMPAAGVPVFITNSAGQRTELVATNGAALNNSLFGTLPAVVTTRFSGGDGKYRLSSAEAVPTLPDLKTLASKPAPDIWSVLASIVSEPYGIVTNGADNKPVFTPRTIHILGRGSSVSTAANDANGQPGRNGGSPRDHVPLWLLRDGIKDKFGPGIDVVDWNYSHGGHVASQGNSQYNEAVAAGMPTAPDIIFDCFGMNDLAPASYNSGQVSPTYMQPNGGYHNEIKGKLDLGVKLIIIATTPHENTDKYAYVMPGGVPMIWPYNIAANVAPDQLVPPAAQSVVTRDWTGRGIRRPGSARAQHVNTMLRDIVRRFNADPAYRGRVILCDAGWAWFRYGLEEHTLTDLYGPQEIVHPIELGHAVSYDRCIREIVDAMQRGTGDKWWFRGEGVDTSAE